MKAMAFDRYGPPDVLRLRDLPDPLPGPGEVLIAIRASVATPSDCAFRSADPFIIRLVYGLFRPKLTIAGTTFAGEVTAIGEGVTRFAVGDRVYGASNKGFGCYAELIALPETGIIAPMPEGIDFGEAAALCEGFLTAMPFLRDGAGLAPGQRLLVNGASGSVGSTAVQLAKTMGAHVTAVASARNREFLAALGADAIIDYQSEDFTAGTARYDVVFDAVGASSFGRARRALMPAGIYLTTVPNFGIIVPMLFHRRADRQRGKLLTTGLRPDADQRADLTMLSAMIAEKKLRPLIDRRYRLEEAATAHAYVETRRKRGSVVIEI